MAFTEGELDQWYQAGKDAAHEAGKVLRRWSGKFSVKEKGRFDLVTDADIESQKVLQEFLLGRFPRHHFLGEEGGMESAEAKNLKSPPCSRLHTVNVLGN